MTREVKVDGAKRQYVQFRCRIGDAEAKTVDYSPPWPISGSGERASMIIKNTGATAFIQVIETPEPLLLQEREAVQKWLLEFLPKGAECVLIESTEEAPLQINGSFTTEIVVTYSLFGRSVRHSILFAKRRVADPKEVFLFELRANPDEFAALHQIFRKSFYSIAGF